MYPLNNTVFRNSWYLWTVLLIAICLFDHMAHICLMIDYILFLLHTYKYRLFYPVSFRLDRYNNYPKPHLFLLRSLFLPKIYFHIAHIHFLRNYYALLCFHNGYNIDLDFSKNVSDIDNIRQHSIHFDNHLYHN